VVYDTLLVIGGWPCFVSLFYSVWISGGWSTMQFFVFGQAICHLVCGITYLIGSHFVSKKKKEKKVFPCHWCFWVGISLIIRWAMNCWYVSLLLSFSLSHCYSFHSFSLVSQVVILFGCCLSFDCSSLLILFGSIWFCFVWMFGESILTIGLFVWWVKCSQFFFSFWFFNLVVCWV